MDMGRGEVILQLRPTPRLFGEVKAPPSKSYTHRAVIVASLDGRAGIVNPLDCDDTRHTISMWRSLGARIEEGGNGLRIRGCAGKPRPVGRSVNVGESGTLLRFSLPILAMCDGDVAVHGEGSLIDRPNRQVADVLRAWGLDIAGRGPEDKLPIRIGARGFLEGGLARVEGHVTSQVVSALLIAAPFARKDTVLKLEHRLVSRPYVDITIDVLRWAGVHVEREGYRVFRIARGQRLAPKSEFVVHGDYSSAAFLLAAGALVDSDIAVSDLEDDCQGDRRIVGILREMGARVVREGDAVRIRGPFELRGVDIDGADTPDLVPILTVLGCFAKGTTRIRNVGHLAFKESDRLAKPAGELASLGARVSFTRDEVVIRHSKLRGGRVSACNDHRLGMALAVAGLAGTEPLTIDGAECISKSYPGFVADMMRLHANIAGVRTDHC